MNRTTFTAAALLTIQALGLDLNLDTEVYLQNEDLTPASTIDEYAPNFFSACAANPSVGDDDLLVDCKCAAWYWGDDADSTSFDCLIDTELANTTVSASKALERGKVSLDNILGSENKGWDKWLAKRVDRATPEGKAWVQFDFGKDNIPASRVVTGVSIKSNKKYAHDPVSVVVSYLLLGSAADEWESLDPIDLDWGKDDRYTELKFELQKDGEAFAPETTSMRFEFTAKDERNKRHIAVQQIQFYGISRQKALFHEYG